MEQCPRCQEEVLVDDLYDHQVFCEAPSNRRRQERRRKDLEFDVPEKEDQKLPATKKPRLVTNTTKDPTRSRDNEEEEEKPTNHDDREKSSLVGRKSPSRRPDDEDPVPSRKVAEKVEEEEKEQEQQPKEEADEFPMVIRWPIEKALKLSRAERAEMKKVLLRQAIREKNEIMSKRTRPTQPLPYYAPLPVGPVSTVLRSDYIREADYPLPNRENHITLHTKHTASVVALKPELDDSSIDEEKPPTPTNGNGDTSSDSSTSSMDEDESTPNQKKYKKQIEAFRNPRQVGVGAELDERDSDIDNVLRSVGTFSPYPKKSQKYLSVLLQVTAEYVENRWDKLKRSSDSPKKYATIYEKVNSTYRSLFCPACMIIDCPYHGNEEEERPADLELEIFHRTRDAKRSEVSD
jgi:hypothetical protein